MKIELNSRTAKCTNLNFAPEKSGDELVERVDMSLEFLAEAEDLNQLVRLEDGDASEVLFGSNGHPQLLDLGLLRLDLKAEGVASISPKGTRSVKAFEGAVLKKVQVEPMIGRKASIRCQVRIDPTGRLEQLAKIRIDEQCQFAFSGAGVLASNTGQTQMAV